MGEILAPLLELLSFLKLFILESFHIFLRSKKIEREIFLRNEQKFDCSLRFALDKENVNTPNLGCLIQKSLGKIGVTKDSC